jgi:hypothetical protein
VFLSTIAPILFCLLGVRSIQSSHEVASPNFFQKIALQGGQTACFCHGYQEGVFLSLFFDN